MNRDSPEWEKWHQFALDFPPTIIADELFRITQETRMIAPDPSVPDLAARVAVLETRIDPLARDLADTREELRRERRRRGEADQRAAEAGADRARALKRAQDALRLADHYRAALEAINDADEDHDGIATQALNAAPHLPSATITEDDGDPT